MVIPVGWCWHHIFQHKMIEAATRTTHFSSDRTVSIWQWCSRSHLILATMNLDNGTHSVGIGRVSGDSGISDASGVCVICNSCWLTKYFIVLTFVFSNCWSFGELFLDDAIANKPESEMLHINCSEIRRHSKVRSLYWCFHNFHSTCLNAHYSIFF